MTKHDEMQNCLKAAIQNAIWSEDWIEGADEISLTNTDVVEALLEITGFYASFHGFEDYSPTDVAQKHALTIRRHIEKYQELRLKGKLSFNFIQRSNNN